MILRSFVKVNYSNLSFLPQKEGEKIFSKKFDNEKDENLQIHFANSSDQSHKFLFVVISTLT